jgi:hypothetical protein
MRFLIIFIIASLFCQNLWGQQSIQGRVINTTGEALSKINILVYLPDSKTLIAYAVSDSEGYFKTVVNSTSDSIDIKLSAIHYKNEFRRIANISQSLDFVMENKIMELEAFTVKAPSIEKRGDTISYLVSSFARKEDRSIDDVLRRMPGIEVESNGRILYQGMPLQKFYVENLDLMDGRYVVVSKNLPHSSVSTIEVLENHQPIRILEDRIASQQASLNLKLKGDITATGTAKLGSGLNPFLWDINITPMIFTKNFQMLTSYQANNTGNDVSQQLKVMTLQDLLQNINQPVEDPGILNIKTVNPLEIAQNRYLDNKIHLLNFNGLLRINRDFQLRTNLYYINDIQRQQASQHRSLYNLTNTLVFEENINNRFFNNYLYSEFTLSRNVKKNYLNNELKIKSRWDKQMGVVFTDGKEITQSLKDPIKSISNELHSVNSIGKHLIEFRSYIIYDHSPHSLAIRPGQFEDVLNHNKPYDKVNQQIDLKRFYADHSAGFVFSWKRLSFTPKLGISYRRQMLESNIFITQEKKESEVVSGFTNKLDNRHTRTYFQMGIEYQKKKLKIKAKLPVSWQQVHLNDLESEQGQRLNRLLFDPGLSISYQISGFWRVRGSWNYVNRLGDIDRVHYGFILKNYRNLSQNAAPLSETSRHDLSSYLSYRNPITSFFNSFRYIYSISNKNLVYSSDIQPDGTTILQAFHKPYTAYSHYFQGKTSKYFSKIKTTISFKAHFNHRQRKSMMNGELFNTTILFYNLIPELNVRITKWLNSEYSLNASYIQTFIEDNKKSNISILRHKINVFAFPTKNKLISLSSEYYNHQGNNNIFVDLLYRYTFKKRNIDIEFRWNNIFNNKTYTIYQASAFTVWESSYVLRPSQVFLSIKFGF